MPSGTPFFRFSLTALFGGVLFVAFGTAAIRFASPAWTGITLALALPILFIAILGALFRIGQPRAFWAGMAVCGWGYLVVVVAPPLEGRLMGLQLGRLLPTTSLLEYAHRQLEKRVPVKQPPAGGQGGMGGGGGFFQIGGGGGGRMPANFNGPDYDSVLNTGHTLFALLFGFIGGVTAKWFYLTRSPNGHNAGGE